jgi:hypothetical protein
MTVNQGPFALEVVVLLLKVRTALRGLACSEECVFMENAAQVRDMLGTLLLKAMLPVIPNVKPAISLVTHNLA